MTVQSDTPVDLGPARDGLSVVDPASPLTRTWYFDGRFLRADGFRADQAYERALASLVAQGTGTGVVHGLEAGLGTGDQVHVQPGLALAPSGRVVLLTRPVDLPTATLVARAQGGLHPSAAPSPDGGAAFAPCALATVTDGDPVLPTTALWVLTVAATETLCGEEERFGQLCVDACATETDRSSLVEGVIFRLHPLTLTMGTPRTVPMTAVHLRSRVASAWFAAERLATASIVYGAGLRSTLWCQGADAAGGEEVPIAVLHREGSASSWLDAWAARRELHETTPERYWRQRVSMRPRSLASAELLQFQCQLAELDLPAVSAVSGSALVDAGVVELPAAGYLGVDPGRDVEAQLRAVFGPGVDLRLCVARADVVPQLVERVRHRDRISLTRGLDDRGSLEEVDILVPDGTLDSAPLVTSAYVGTAKVLPASRGDQSGSAVSLAAMARDVGTAGWSWAAAGIGELPAARLPDPVTRLARGRAQRVRRLAAVDAALRALIRPDGAHLGSGRTVAAWAQLSTAARVDAMRPGDTTDVRGRFSFTATVDDVSLMDTRFTGELRVVDRVAGTDNGAPSVQLTTVLDGFLDRFTMDNGKPTSRVDPVRAMTTTWLFGVDENGAQRIEVAIRQGAFGMVLAVARGGNPSTITAVLGRFGLRVDPLPPVTPPVLNAPAGAPATAEPAAGGDTSEATGWASGVRGAFAAVFDRITTSGLLGANRIPLIDPGLRRAFLPGIAIGVPGPLGPLPGITPIATAELTDTAGATAPGSAIRAQSDTAIELIAAGLASAARDPVFAVGARNLLYGPDVTTSGVHPAKDWVLFHRRETITCAGADVASPVLRTLRLLHADAASADALKAIIDALNGGGAVGNLGFAPVVDLEFPQSSAQIASSVAALRIAWQASPRPDQLGMVVSAGDPDGQLVAAGRIDALRAALTDLADTSAAQVGFLPTVPPEFAAIGVDAVLLTAGVRAAPVATCARLLRISRSNAAELLKTLRTLQADPGVPLEDLMTQQRIPVDAVSASFSNGAPSNTDSIVQWWGGSASLQTTVLTPQDLGDGTDPLKARMDRAKVALSEIGLEVQSQFHVQIQMPPCGVAVLISVE